MEVILKGIKKARVAEVASLKESLSGTPSIGSDRPMRQIVALLEQETKDGFPTGSAYLHHLKNAAEIRLTALRNHLIAVTQKWSVQAGLQSVLEEVDSDPIGRHSVESMAMTSGYSRGYFLRSFRLLTGVTPHQYLVQRRLEHARAMISTSSQPIAIIALRCGFASDSHLNRAFKKYFGIVPSTYRSQSRLAHAPRRRTRP